MKILITPTSFGDCSYEPLEILKEHFEVEFNPYKRKLTEEEVIDLAKDSDAILAGLEPLNKRVIDSLPKLKCISRVGSGMDNVDIEYAEKKGIKVRSTPLGPSRAVAELAVALTFSLLRKIPLADKNIRKGKWKKEFGNLILNKVVGIIGLGKIGKISAGLFRNIGNEVIGCDIYPDEDWAVKNSIKLMNKNELLEKSDIVILHVPLTGEGGYLIGINELNMMKKNALLINVSRGKIVNENELYNVLSNNKIGGAAVDVFENEPYKGNLTELDNIILTPHLGSYAIESRIQMEIDSVRNLIDSLK